MELTQEQLKALRTAPVVRVEERTDIKLWRIDLSEEHNISVDVEANSPDEARQKILAANQ